MQYLYIDMAVWICIGQPTPVFYFQNVIFENVDSQVIKKGRYLLHALLQSWVLCVREHVPEVGKTGTHLSFQGVISQKFNNFTFHCSTVKGEACDNWGQRRHWDLERVLNDMEKLIVHLGILIAIETLKLTTCTNSCITVFNSLFLSFATSTS